MRFDLKTLCGLVLAFAAMTGAAQAACPTGLPPGVFCGEKNLAAAASGTYALDPDHAAVIARVSHIGYSMSVFRFDRVQGQLVWDAANPAASKLTAAVQTASIATNVKDFAKELSGDAYLKSAAFPQATFVSSAFHPTDATHGKVDGLLTLLGKTRPATFDVTLIGSGKVMGQARIGVHATTSITPQDFGMSPFFLDPIELVIDAEFGKAA
ncbi:polyisoprenoid-binding protein [Phenylobacterium hankyongense]|uniref:Polyisoprenoid-binding protein n=1 Tax=Phenylobacterium hankyongense TaxID=1813876 RepID=A0A328AYY5_9CAUL|nr:YceI family protein [Phenylobacterium hankyongense]RAK60320.1 polyisoprenoid-binding protein [Phenylobacterium hankyongense]